VSLKATLYNSGTGLWESYENPVGLLKACEVSEVRSVLQSAESASQKGLTAIGFVSFEAAAAFDETFISASSDRPLALFGLYDRINSVSSPVFESGAIELHPKCSRSAYLEQVAIIKAYLAAGDSYQVNLTHQLEGPWRDSVEGLFARLISSQPTVYATCLDWQDGAICSVSPELFFSLDQDVIRTEPMKGTRSRGKTPAEDLIQRVCLVDSEKDRAENLMIVDMIRNDLSKIAEMGTVAVDQLFELRQLPTVWQQVSRVSARTRAGVDEIFAALFPCASITGAPKSRTLEIITELEGLPRGVYTGAIGYIKPNRQAQFSVAIRTLVVDKEAEQLSYGVGGGIVWDSEPEKEWQETLDKAALLNVASSSFRLLETLLFSPGSGVYLLEYHLDRLENSARYFGFEFNRNWIDEKLSAFQSVQQQRLRLLLRRSGEIEIQAVPCPRVVSRVRLKLAAISLNKMNPFLFHKTTHRSVYENARVGQDDCDDVLLWNESGELTETTIYNIYVEIDGKLLTPPVSSGLLAGVYRREMLATGRAVESRLFKEDLDRATRIFVSNSVRGLVSAEMVSS
jgi:para-aminobenzoate synthetase / 4-amino-4-deoxychorismate lyase